MIKNVIIAVATMEEQRTTLTGVLFTSDGAGLTAVSTDGRRLVKVFEPLDEPATKPFSVIIPQRSLREIQNLLGDSDEPVFFTLSEGQVFINFNSTFIFSRIIEGKFPGFEAVIPLSSEIKLLTDRVKTQDAVKRALIMAMDKDAPDLLRLEINMESIKITANSVDVGDAYEEVFLDEMTGDSIELAVNGKYLLDILNVVNDDYIWIYINKPDTPVMIKSPLKENYLFIIMPVRLQKIQQSQDEDIDSSVHSYT